MKFQHILSKIALSSMIVLLSAGYTSQNTNLSVLAERSFADINGDGKINASDAGLILQYAAATGAGYTESIETFLEELEQPTTDPPAATTLAAPELTNFQHFLKSGIQLDFYKITWNPIEHADGYEYILYFNDNYEKIKTTDCFYEYGTSIDMTAVIRVRAYAKNTDGTLIYSDWSDVKSSSYAMPYLFKTEFCSLNSKGVFQADPAFLGLTVEQINELFDADLTVEDFPYWSNHLTISDCMYNGISIALVFQDKKLAVFVYDTKESLSDTMLKNAVSCYGNNYTLTDAGYRFDFNDCIGSYYEISQDIYAETGETVTHQRIFSGNFY